MYQKILMQVNVYYVRLTGQYFFFYKTYFKPKIHKTITSN